jgi:hypothetical protein
MKKEVFSWKKGVTHTTLMFVSQIIIPFFVFAVLAWWVKDYSSGQSFDKNYIVRDSATITSLLLSSPDYLTYKYPLINPYILNVDKNVISISSKNDKAAISYIFHENEFANLETMEDLDARSSFYITNSADSVAFSEKNPDFKPYRNFCLGTSHSKIKELGVDPIETSGLSEDFTLKIADSMGSNLGNLLSFTLTREQNQNRAINLLDNRDFIIGLRMGDYSGDKNYVKIYYLLDSNFADSSRYLGCLILNNILSEVSIDGASLVPIISTGRIAAQDSILETSKSGIIIEIGSLNSNKVSELIAKSDSYGKSIADALREYQNDA